MMQQRELATCSPQVPNTKYSQSAALVGEYVQR